MRTDRRHVSAVLRRLALISAFVATACTTASVEGSKPTTSATASPSATGSSANTGATTPRARAYSVMADIPGQGVVLLGGQYGTPPGTPLSDLWRFNPKGGWRQLAPETGRGTDAFAFDSDSKLVIAVENAGTWTYDPADGTWQDLETTGHPQNIWGTRLAYDSGSDRMILFGGLDGSRLYDQTWALDLKARTWERMHPAKSPPPQNFHTMAYDPDADRVILFSNEHPSTWAYDYDTDTWTDLAPKLSPQVRGYSAMVYDPVGHRMILFGGVREFLEKPLGDTWAFDFARNTWTNLDPAVAPSARGWHAMAFDAETEKVVLFSGGATRDTDLTDVWLFDPATDTWSQAG